MKTQQITSNYLRQSILNHKQKLCNRFRQSDFITHVKQNIQQAKCMLNKEAILYCCKKDCKENALICGQSKCQCKTKHQFCFNSFQSQTLLKYIDKKQQKQRNFIKQIQDKIDKIIDQLSTLKDKLIEPLKNIQFEEQQLSILNYFQKKKWKQLIGSTLNKFCLNFQESKNQLTQSIKIKSFKINFQQFSQSIVNIIHTFDSSLDSNETLINQNSLKLLRIWHQQKNLNSKIITNFQELKHLYHFMPKNKIKELKLLYRASQNDFSTKIFYEKCSDVANTLTLIKTQHNKIIGGYTPIPWKKYQDKHQSSDQSGESFIFSLTNNHKFKLVDNQNATFYSSESFGPIFGNNYGSIAIKDKANQNEKSLTNLHQKYVNQNYKHEQSCFKLFTGSSIARFKILEWQVLQVIY